MTDRKTVHRERITITKAADSSGLSVRAVHECISRGFVDQEMTEAQLACLRRVRRLLNLGINWAGVEVVLHMRQQIEALQKELARLQAHYERQR
jgi:DNA-binding transcriptional MerR regulator